MKLKKILALTLWFGAGNSNLDNPDSDSSIQTYDNIYDANWMKEGNKYISSGVERIDIIKDDDGSYHTEKIWTREDIRETCMIKLSTATGYLYGYWQNMDTEEWGYDILNFDTGETVLEAPVSKSVTYNNMAVGMMVDVSGNALYCPTNEKILLRLQDRFVYLPDYPSEKVNLEETGRKNISAENFYAYSDVEETPASFLNTAAFDLKGKSTTVAFRVNGLLRMLLRIN